MTTGFMCSVTGHGVPTGPNVTTAYPTNNILHANYADQNSLRYGCQRLQKWKYENGKIQFTHANDSPGAGGEALAPAQPAGAGSACLV